MLREEDDDVSDPILGSLFNQSLQIDADLEFQNAMSKREFYHEELCGWTVDQTVYHRFKWNSQRKLLKTPNKDAKSVNTNPRRSFSRQGIYRTNDIEFDFKHYQHRVNYIEQYRNEKLLRQDAGLTDILAKSTMERRKLKTDVCDECIHNRTSPTESSSDVLKLEHTENSLSAGITSSIEPAYHGKKQFNTGIFHGKKLFSRPVFRHSSLHNNSRDTNWTDVIDSSIVGLHSPAALCKQTPPVCGMEESWTIVGVEKRPLPQQRKRTDLFSALSSKSHRKDTSRSSRYQKYSTSTNKCDAWVKNRQQELGGPYGSESFRVTPRSNSAPSIYNNTLGGRHSLWKSPEDAKKSHTNTNESKGRGTASSSSKMDYSCYTEMFKNVLEYYGTKKLQPKPKLPAATNAENGRLLSVKT